MALSPLKFVPFNCFGNKINTYCEYDELVRFHGLETVAIKFS